MRYVKHNIQRRSSRRAERRAFSSSVTQGRVAGKDIKKRSGLSLALRIRFRQWRHWRNLNDVQTALSFCSARPAPSPGIFAGLYGPRAMRATDAWIVLIMERVVRDVMFVEIAPNLFRSPIRDRIHLHQPEFSVPLDFSGILTNRSLVAANTRDPRTQLTKFAAERLNLAQIAALVGILRPEVLSVNACLRHRREQRKHSLNLYSIFLLDPVHQVVRL